MRTEILHTNIACAVVARDLESSRPLDAADLLRAAADYIESEHTKQSAITCPLQPFIVTDIAIDLYNGTVSIYYHQQSIPD